MEQSICSRSRIVNIHQSTLILIISHQEQRRKDPAERSASSVECPAAAAFAHLCSLPGGAPPLLFLLLLWTCVSYRIVAMRSAARNWELARGSEAEEIRSCIYRVAHSTPFEALSGRQEAARDLPQSGQKRATVPTIQFEH